MSLLFQKSSVICLKNSKNQDFVMWSHFSEVPTLIDMCHINSAEVETLHTSRSFNVNFIYIIVNHFNHTICFTDVSKSTSLSIIPQWFHSYNDFHNMNHVCSICYSDFISIWLHFTNFDCFLFSLLWFDYHSFCTLNNIWRWIKLHYTCYMMSYARYYLDCQHRTWYQ